MDANSTDLSRRTILKAAAALPLAAAIRGAAQPSAAQPGATSSLGTWADDAAGLPCFRYTGPFTFKAPGAAVPAAYLPADPHFLLGNYRLTLFAHVSGMLQIVSGERAWGRLNQGKQDWSGLNEASVRTGSDTVALVGLHAPAAEKADKTFGVGYAQYAYPAANSLRVTRTVSVLPSSKPGDGHSAFVVSVTLRNEGSAAIVPDYAENFGAKYAQIFAVWDMDRRLVKYQANVTRQAEEVRCDFTAAEPRPLMFSHQGRMARFEGAPPSLYVRTLSAPQGLSVETTAGKDQDGVDRIGVRATGSIAAGRSVTFHSVVGYAYAHADIDAAVDALSAAITDGAAPQFQQQWKARVPEFPQEKDSALRREMRWNAGELEQMTTWREYYDETVVPQGMDYDYKWGNMASSRDLAQQALPMCHLNPAIAKCTLRWIMKRTLADGEIKLDDMGFGWAPTTGRLTSDQQLYFFLLLNEYLRKTGDSAILTEQVGYYPREATAQGSGLDHVRDAFLFLRDRIGTGPHGLVKLWNSDWNDMFFFWPTTESYNTIFDTSESHMNSAMACVILSDLADALKKHAPKQADQLIEAVTQYRAKLLKAFLADWGSAPFPKRMYFQHQAIGGADNMWLEPQGFTLLIAEVAPERKRRLFNEMQSRLMHGEAMGPKQIEKPYQKPGTPAGTRENGGFWYALTGPVVLGVATFDKQAAEAMLRQMTFANYARHFPDYWIGQWTAPDSLDSAAVPTQGLSAMLTQCAHAHAWPLYLYLRLRES